MLYFHRLNRDNVRANRLSIFFYFFSPRNSGMEMKMVLLLFFTYAHVFRIINPLTITRTIRVHLTNIKVLGFYTNLV